MSVFKFLLAFVLINWPSSLSVLSQQDSLQVSNQQSTLKPIVERVFSRKKRWMIFPKGSNLKFTVNVSKRLLAQYPKGFSFVLEAAIYYPMPSNRIDLIPKKFRKPTTKKPAFKGPTPVYLVGIPGSLIEYRAKPATQTPKVQRIYQNVSSLQWAPAPASAPPPAPAPTNWYSQKWSKYSSPEYLKNYQWSPEKQQKYVNKYSKYNNKWYSNSRLPSQHSSNYNWRQNYHKWNQQPRYGRNVNEFDEPHFSSPDDLDVEYEPIYFEELESYADSPHYHSYRARRELFHHFEGLSTILGIDMKSCILRALCDSKRFLLPPGYSMIQDILRIIFTFPTISGLTDEYSRIMQADYQTCDAHIHNKCPFSILDWLLNSRKTM